MNDSLDLRNRILKMRESNNFNVSKQDSLNNNLMSEFESSIKDDNKKVRNSEKQTVIDQNKESVSDSTQNNSKNLIDLHCIAFNDIEYSKNISDNACEPFEKKNVCHEYTLSTQCL